MSSSRFVVIKLKDIIKTLILIAAAVILVIALIIFIGKTGTRQSLYNPGTYTSTISFGDEEVTVSVELSKNKIKSVSVSEPTETIAVFYPLFGSSAKDISEKIVENQSADIPLSSSNPITENIILDAAKNCISQGKL